MPGWYWTDAQAQPQGPYDVEGLIACVGTGHVVSSSLLWTDGQEWLPLAQIPALKEVHDKCLMQSAPEQTSTPAVDSAASEAIAALRAEAGADAGQAGDAAAPSAAPATPDPEDMEFEEEGVKYHWDRALRKYVPEDMAAGGEGYDVSMMTFDAVEENIPDVEHAKEGNSRAAPKSTSGGKKRPADGAAGADSTSKGRGDSSKKAKGTDAKQPPARQNTSIYITGLPDDAEVEEVKAVFQKCGLIKMIEDSTEPRIKLYRDPQTGFPKGDGLVVYLRPESVALACQILDGTPLRPDGGVTMAVKAAEFQDKGGDKPSGGKKAKKAGGGKHKKKTATSQKEERALGWDGFDDELPPEETTVVLRNIFHPDDFLLAPTLAEELQSDITAEAEKLGKVEKVQIYKNNEEGAATVKFFKAEPAQACLKVMNGRFFGGRQVAAAMWDGIATFWGKRKETEEEEKARLEAYSRDLERGTLAKPSQTGTA